MPNHPAPRRKDHLTFCLNEGWTEVRNAVGQPVRHHQTFELALLDGRALRTHISRPPDSKETYGPGLWGRILKDQLAVTAKEFWACVQDGAKPDRGASPLPIETIPAGVLTLLLEYGVPEAEALGLTRAEAIERLNLELSKPRS